MISTAHKFIFLHVSKTGGNSLQEALLPLSDDTKHWGEWRDGLDRYEVKGPITPTKHATLAQYHEALGEALADYAIVIPVRHPFDRALSYYFSPHRWMRQSDDGQWAVGEPSWSLDGFVELIETVDPMVKFLEVDGTTVQPTHVIRFEHLAEDFATVIRRLDLPVTPTLPHRNPSAATSEMRALAGRDEAARRAVERRFAKDFELFGY